MSILSKPYFHNEEATYEFVESKLWPNGATCPKCGERERVSKMQGKSTRIGAYKCYKCREPFTVKVGTIFESSHVKMHLWLQAIFLIASSKKCISANQLHRTLGVTLKTAWFMGHRIREAMKSTDFTPFGSGGGFVEVDETYMGQTEGHGKDSHTSKKRKILGLIDRDTKQVRTMVMNNITVADVAPVVRDNLDREAKLMTDKAGIYIKVGKEFAAHHSVDHGKGEYVRKGNKEIHTNTIENYFSVFKRGMKGTYQHCGHHHPNRYLAEFDFRYNNRAALEVSNVERAEKLLTSVIGKRLTYQSAH
ncbi:IS1595 family transposase [Ketobacter sp. MCCC 1A13808]|uniref:IS1595 family transposase n=1 Tax=Ketobacter sp. MCCC 1A13808 TaxID=2602738 RepID=UPI0012EB8D7E|nr:IS1595 family transposase [Ketobacter sp. MCCC 1A13808]MVF11858.1 IS1595 family transposase [Ketobacter sp. MCCC 1A13808]